MSDIIRFDNIARINGQNGKYDNSVSNSSIRYGRNAIDNFKQYISSFSCPSFELPKMTNLSQLDNDTFEKRLEELDNMLEEMLFQEDIPLGFELQYSKTKDGQIDTMSLMGAAYEEMEQKTKISTEEMDLKLQETFGDTITSKALDLNNDDKIDVAEYATSILLNDSLDGKIDGIITNEGQNAGLEYSKKENESSARIIYKTLYYKYGLDKAKQDFLSEINGIKLQ